MNRYFINIVTTLMMMVTATNAVAASPVQCSTVFASADMAPTPGANRGPIEYFRNLKMKYFPTKMLKYFNQPAYEKAFKQIKEQGLRIEEGFVPKSIEEYTAYLDVQLAELNTSIAQMQPLFRHKIFKTIDKILTWDTADALTSHKELTDLIFRGSTARPNSFRFLLTHSPEAVSRELFAQHMYSLAVSKVVVESLEFNPGPRRPGLVGRMTPAFAKKHKEILSATFWAGVGIGTSIHGQMFNVFLGPLSIYKTAGNTKIIETAFIEKGYEEAFRILEPQFSQKSEYNYTYLVTEKTLNWMVLLLIGMDLTLIE
ncbi:hypothetical protein ACLVWU_10960 [Bdellovibrio sp. HCB290]|uniref:hypothetical protein n=1 Tax=Bdellovibrio sp. HCB290 TaxID=3394356 RepID=UPI0039B4E100